MPSDMMNGIVSNIKAMMVAGVVPDLKNTNYTKVRHEVEMTLLNAPVEEGVRFSTDYLGGVEIELSTPDNLTSQDIIIYLHAGGFLYGNARTSRSFASQIANKSGMCVYSVSYRLAPEHIYPTAVNDCFEVYKEVVKLHSGSKVSLVGDSAGANLSLVTALKAMKEGIKLPASVTVYSPPTDLATNLASRSLNKESDPIVPSNFDQLIIQAYCPKANPHDNYISPLLADYKGFPPLKIVVERSEVLFDDSDLLAKKAKKAGVEVEYQIWENTFHAFPSLGKTTPESAQVLTETIEFIRRNC